MKAPFGVSDFQPIGELDLPDSKVVLRLSSRHKNRGSRKRPSSAWVRQHMFLFPTHFSKMSRSVWRQEEAA